MVFRWFSVCAALLLLCGTFVACGPECPQGQIKCGEACVNPNADRNNCGDCGTKCNAGQVCDNGSCKLSCQSELTECGGRCVNLKTDNAFCGDCDTSCDDGEVCTDGKCVLNCPDGQTACGSSCVDTKRDPGHCGGCDSACAKGEACVDGKCQIDCPQELRNCSGACINTKSDPAHCGECDKACAQGEACNEGACQPACPEDKTNCSGACIDTKTDPRHCGACGTACKGGEICKDSKCELVCGTEFTDCSGACVNTKTDTRHCGACGTACKTSEICKDGTCELSCPQDTTICTDACIDTQTDAAHCGSCGNACKAGEVCDAGACKAQCQQGFTSCSQSCVDLQTDSRHCGKCAAACGQNQSCLAGKCEQGCAPGDANCGTAAAPYCSDTSSDALHCGTCGTKCAAGEICTEGKCKACADCPLWAGNYGAFNSDYVYDVAVDSNGYVYITGYFNAVAQVGSFRLKSRGSGDIFVAKLNPSGRVIWAASGGGSNADYGRGVAVDSAGNVYVTGYFNGNGSLGANLLTSQGGNDIFVAKLDKDGNWLWAKGYGSTSSDYGYAIAVDSAGNSHVTGYFYNTTAFGSTSLTSNGGGDIFLLKLDKDGKELWAKGYGSTSTDYGYDVALDSTGNAHLVGRFYNTASFGTVSLSAKGSSDIFVAKHDSTGNVSWAVRAGGSSVDYGYGIAVDGSGNAYITGAFQSSSTTPADFGTTNLQSAGGYDIFVAKLDNTGKFTWATSAGGTSSDYGYGVGVDSTGRVFATGYFSSSGATIGGIKMESKGGNDIYLAQLNANGQFAGALQIGGTSSDYGYTLAVDSSDNVYIGGYFSNILPLSEVSLLTNGSSDGFVAKYAKPGVFCPKGGSVCSGVCLDTQSDINNCGSCGNKCAGSQLCGGGICKDCTDCPKSFASGAASVSSAYGYGYATATDSAGNIFLAGYFYKEMEFGTTKLTSAGSADIFVAKADKDGKWLWAQRLGTASADYVYGMATDASGNVYIAGRFGSSTNKSMSVGLSTLTSVGGSDLFVAKFTASGNPLWGASGGSSSTDYAYGVAVDSNEVVHVVGYTYSSGTFGLLNTTAAGSADVFYGRVDKLGNWVMAKTYGGTSSDYGRGIALDSAGNAYITGYTSSTSGATFDSITASVSSTPEIFAAKIDTTGKAVWAVASGGTSSQYGYAIAADNSGNAYVTGYMTSSGATFGSLPKLNSTGGNDMYVVKIDSTGKWAWAKAFGGTSTEYGYGVGVDSTGHIFLAGYSNSSTLTVGPFSMPRYGGYDFLLIKLNSMGDVIGASSGGGTGSDYVRALAVGSNGEVYVSGETYSTEMEFSKDKYPRSTSSTPAPYVVHFGATPCPIAGPYAVCGAVCAALQSNDDHCGACNNKCTTGQTCQSGTCQ